MADNFGVLSPADQEVIQNWWKRHWKHPVVCPVCKTSEWGVGPHIVNIERHAVDANTPNTVSYPHIMVTCKACAHTMFFNAVQIGVAARSPNPSFTLPPLPTPPVFANALSNALSGSPASPPAQNPFEKIVKKNQ